NAGYAIEPLNAPLPTAWYLPFQPDTGIHTSILTSESLVGRSVAATRQNAGSARAPRAAASSGGVNPPASTSRASVIVAVGMASADSLSQLPPSTDGASNSRSDTAIDTTADSRTAETTPMKNRIAGLLSGITVFHGAQRSRESRSSALRRSHPSS